MKKQSAMRVLRKAIKNPFRYIVDLRAMLTGCAYIVYFRIFRPRVKIGFPFFAYYTVSIKGPGTVLIGKGCSVYKNVLQGLSIVTLSTDAKVVIGRHCALGGVTIRCRDSVEIDDRTMAGYSIVQDCLIIKTDMIRNDNFLKAIMEPEPIKIGKNVWLGGRSCILGGTIIRNDSVISAGSVCYKSEVKEYSLAFGNPIMRSSPIPQILKLAGKS